MLADLIGVDANSYNGECYCALLSNISAEVILLLGAVIVILFGLFCKTRCKSSCQNSATTSGSQNGLCTDGENSSICFTRGEASSWIVGLLFVILAMVKLVQHMPTEEITLFHGHFVSSSLTNVLKICLLFMTSLILIFYGGVYKETKWMHGVYEYVGIILIAVFGCCILISARHLLTLYVGLEVVSLSSYVLASYDRDNQYSTEAGIKYFILGSLTSCILLLGMSFVYGFSGSLFFSDIYSIFIRDNYSIGLLWGVALIIIAILFKLSIAPFHFWTIDVYHGSPMISVAFFSSVTKFSVLVVLLNILYHVAPIILNEYHNVFLFFGALSIVLGTFGAVSQQSIKRLLGYSTVLNMGFLLMALATGQNVDIGGVVVLYQLIYGISSIGLLSILFLCAPNKSYDDITLDDLAKIGTDNKLIRFFMLIFVFSMIGIPPLAGFFPKFYVIRILMQSDFYLTSVFILLMSVVAAFFYLKFIKNMYFVQNTHGHGVNIANVAVEKILIPKRMLFVICVSITTITLLSLDIF